MRRITSLAAAAALGVGCVAADALAAERHGAARDRTEVNGAGAHRAEVNGGNYYRPGAGIAAGALVGGAIAASRPWNGYGGYGYDSGYYNGYGPSYGGYGYDPGYQGYQGYQGYDVGYTGYSAAGGQDAAYCAQRFRSYDPASGTYLGYDGQRHPCP
jgi:BA14K-like protein